MLMDIITHIAAAAGALLLGYRIGARELWRRMQADRGVGLMALEGLARAHGARVEVDDLPGG